LCVALRLEPVSIWSTSAAKLRAGDRALRTREHLLPLMRESASVRGVSESSSWGRKFLRVLSPPSSVAFVFSHVCVSSLRDTCRLHILSLLHLHWVWNFFPYGEGGFLILTIESVILCPSNHCVRSDGSSAIIYRVRYLKGGTRLCFRTILFLRDCFSLAMTILVRTMSQATDFYCLGCVLLKECALSNTFMRCSLEHRD
jgi:hypothetical protein